MPGGAGGARWQPMSTEADSRGRTLEEPRAGVVAGLRSRRRELADAIFARVRDDLLGAVGAEDAEYSLGLHQAVAVAVDYVLEGIERGTESSGVIPAEVISQARRAARAGVSLDTVIRNYVAAYTLVETFIVEEAERSDLSGEAGPLRGILGARASLIDRLLTAITGAYGDELQQTERSPDRRRTQLVYALLAGQAVDPAELVHNLDEWHLAVIATGAAAPQAVMSMASGLDRRLLSVPHGAESVWAWLSGRRRLTDTDIERWLSAEAHPDVLLAVGEPGRGIDGWRLTHRQAQAALLVALRTPRPQRLTRYADVALLASALRDDVLARSLIEIFLSPLDSQRDGGAVSRATLRAYFTSGHNIKVAAAALGVERRTVAYRLQKAEECLGRRLDTHHAELEVALRLEVLYQDSIHTNDTPSQMLRRT
jgi:PucR C-terminal helix-turn-helix domain/GGDEF-like domain